MSCQYGDAIYETEVAAREAAINDYLTASGTQSVEEGIDPDDTPKSIARDMIREGWTLPGMPYYQETAAQAVEDMAVAIHEYLIRRDLDHDHE